MGDECILTGYVLSRIQWSDAVTPLWRAKVNSGNKESKFVVKIIVE